jgi:hypothetical protein
MDVKTCKKCGAEKQLSHFYKHPKTADRRSGSCKECDKSSVREYRKKNAALCRAYDAKRFQDDPKVKARHKRYRETPAGKESMAKSRKKWVEGNPELVRQVGRDWAERNPEKVFANNVVNNAVRDGKLSKPDACQECGASGLIHGHHEDYMRPLDVDWLCPACHGLRHRA